MGSFWFFFCLFLFIETVNMIRIAVNKRKFVCVAVKWNKIAART